LRKRTLRRDPIEPDGEGTGDLEKCRAEDFLPRYSFARSKQAVHSTRTVLLTELLPRSEDLFVNNEPVETVDAPVVNASIRREVPRIDAEPEDDRQGPCQTPELGNSHAESSSGSARGDVVECPQAIDQPICRLQLLR